MKVFLHCLALAQAFEDVCPAEDPSCLLTDFDPMSFLQVRSTVAQVSVAQVRSTVAPASAPAALGDLTEAAHKLNAIYGAKFGSEQMAFLNDIANAATQIQALMPQKKKLEEDTAAAKVSSEIDKSLLKIRTSVKKGPRRNRAMVKNLNIIANAVRKINGNSQTSKISEALSVIKDPVRQMYQDFAKSKNYHKPNEIIKAAKSQQQIPAKVNHAIRGGKHYEGLLSKQQNEIKKMERDLLEEKKKFNNELGAEEKLLSDAKKKAKKYEFDVAQFGRIKAHHEEEARKYARKLHEMAQGLSALHGKHEPGSPAATLAKDMADKAQDIVAKMSKPTAGASGTGSTQGEAADKCGEKFEESKKKLEPMKTLSVINGMCQQSCERVYSSGKWKDIHCEYKPNGGCFPTNGVQAACVAK